jgi:hypothetical protein
MYYGQPGSYLNKGRFPPARKADHFAFDLPGFLRIESPPHLDAMGVVHEPVEDTVGQGGIADRFVPA